MKSNGASIKEAIKFVEENYLKNFLEEINSTKEQECSIFESKPIESTQTERNPETFVYNSLECLKSKLNGGTESICYLNNVKKIEMINFITRLPEIAETFSFHRNFVHFASTPAFVAFGHVKNDDESVKVEYKALASGSYYFKNKSLSQICRYVDERFIKRKLMIEKGEKGEKGDIWLSLINEDYKFFPYLMYPEENNSKNNLKYILRISFKKEEENFKFIS